MNRPTPRDVSAEELAEIGEALRAMFAQRFPTMPAEALASCLGYELVRYVCLTTNSYAEAHEVIERFHSMMHAQVEAFPEGMPHP